MRELLIPLLLLSLFALQGCSATPTAAPKGDWAIAIHGGAGVLDKVAPPEERAEYARSLAAALEIGRNELARGGTALDAVQKVVNTLEENPLFNAGKGAVFTYDGTHELDASIMDGATLKCGAVAGVKTVRSPVGLARLVMDRSPHVLLTGDGAEQFATKMGVDRVDNTFFDTPQRREYWKERRAELDKQSQTPADPRSTYGTVGAVALDSHGNLAAATSTGGLTCKRWGRVGDTPIIGAGNYADAHAAISCTGTGEEFIRHGVARQIALLVEMNRSAAGAADTVVNHRLKPDDGGVIVISRTGEIAMIYNSEGMFRGAADSRGRFDVSIWDKPETITEAAK
ncbi:MAG TPA: isoaspartyl peptidase/L-asparaginase [Phycisphaerales bacterium]|nr:isoaspartyl peptidase/L-asparaginase [Phycisphaerales bacterium]